MYYFNVPADFKKETIDKYAALHSRFPHCRVLETYGNITSGTILQSGRAIENIPEIDIDALQDYIQYCRARDIGFNYTMNCTTLANREFSPEGIDELKFFFQKLYKIGVRTLIVALPALIEIIKSTGLDFDIKASVLCQITTPNKARKYKELGVGKIVPDESIQRDFGTLKRIRKVFGEKVELIVNPLCNKDCHYRMFHYNQLSLENAKESNGISNSYYPNRCIARFYYDLSAVFRVNWIRPEDLKHYADIGINYFKLQGRHNLSLKLAGGSRQDSRGDLVKVVEAYFKEDYDGDLTELLYIFNPAYRIFRVPLPNKTLEGFLKPFIENERFCVRDCTSCHYCDNFAEKVLDQKKFNQVNQQLKMFLNSFDNFKKKIWNGSSSGSSAFPL